MKAYHLINNDKSKAFASKDYTFIFDKKTGFFARWGATKADDPQWSPFGPEIADIEISSAASKDIAAHTHSNSSTIITDGGCSGIGCKDFCYKQNTSGKTIHMSLDMFKKIMDRMPKTLTQIAFGLCSVDSHPQVWEIFEETRSRGFIPNVTINGIGITDEVASKLSNVCGAVAVSVNPKNRQIAYGAVKKLSQDNEMKQINFHIVLAEDTVEFVRSVVDDIQTDERLSKLNALVMLSFKDKGNTKCFSPITLKSYKEVVEYCEQGNIAFGFDSCSASTYIEAIKGRPDYNQLCQCVEPCESGLFSVYINVFGDMFACSFYENEGIWKEGLSVCDYDSMVDLWHDPRVQQWREVLLANDRKCPLYQIGSNK